MTIQEYIRNDVVVVSLGGNLLGDPDTSQMRERFYTLLEGKSRKFVIDLTGVRLINSSGLGALLAVLTSIKNRKGDLRLANVSANVASLLLITKLVTILKIYDTVERALDSYGNE